MSNRTEFEDGLETLLRRLDELRDFDYENMDWFCENNHSDPDVKCPCHFWGRIGVISRAFSFLYSLKAIHNVELEVREEQQRPRASVTDEDDNSVVSFGVDLKEPRTRALTPIKDHEGAYEEFVDYIVLMYAEGKKAITAEDLINRLSAEDCALDIDHLSPATLRMYSSSSLRAAEARGILERVNKSEYVFSSGEFRDTKQMKVYEKVESHGRVLKVYDAVVQAILMSSGTVCPFTTVCVHHYLGDRTLVSDRGVPFTRGSVTRQVTNTLRYLAEIDVLSVDKSHQLYGYRPGKRFFEYCVEFTMWLHAHEDGDA